MLIGGGVQPRVHPVRRIEYLSERPPHAGPETRRELVVIKRSGIIREFLQGLVMVLGSQPQPPPLLIAHDIRQPQRATSSRSVAAAEPPAVTGRLHGRSFLLTSHPG